jgi:hypothetical protein
MKKTYYKKIIFIFSFFGLSFFNATNEAKSFSNNFSNKLLVGIDLSSGFSSTSSDDFYLKLRIESDTSATDTTKIITTENSPKYNFEFDSALSGEVSFDYVSNSGLLYGFGLSYGQFKGVDPKFKTTYLQLNNKTLMLHGGYLMSFKMFAPYLMIGAGFDSVNLEGRIPFGGVILTIQDIPGYKRGAFSASIGSFFSLSNVLLSLAYKFQGSLNFKDDIIISDASNRIYTDPTLVNPKVTREEYQKFLNQTHMVSISIKIPI